MSKKLNREIKCIDHLQGHNKRQGFSHYTDRDIRSNVLFAPNQCSRVECGYKVVTIDFVLVLRTGFGF